MGAGAVTEPLDVAHARLAHQRLTGAPLPDPAAVVRHLGAVQAQTPGPARWSLGQRCGADDAGVLRALDDGAIVRTHALRPTWHFLAAEDVRWVQALTSPRIRAMSRYYERQNGIDDALVAWATPVVVDALGGGNHLTRTELGAALARAGIEADGGRLAYLVMRAELDALVVSGVRRGAAETYALLAERAPRQRELEGDDALAELARRYFTSHGPAGARDFAWWSSLTLTAARRALALVQDELVATDLDGTALWGPPGDAGRGGPRAHVLQGYDEYTVAYSATRDVADVAGLARAAGRPLVTTMPLVLDSQVVGSWRQTMARRQVTAHVELLVELDEPGEAALAEAFARYSAFTGLPVAQASSAEPSAASEPSRDSAR